LAEVHIVLFPPDQRRRDIDNYNKALFDALTQTGVWEDDSQVKRMLVEWGPLTKKGKVELRLSDLFPRQLQLPDKWKRMNQLTPKNVVDVQPDIADLVESRHDDVKRSIERLAERDYSTSANGGC
jgi:hypothetical protein